MSLPKRLLSRLLAASTIAACGSSGGSNVGTITPSGSSGASGEGGSSAGTPGSGGVAGAAGTPASGGVADAAGTPGSGGVAGSAGTPGSGGVAGFAGTSTAGGMGGSAGGASSGAGGEFGGGMSGTSGTSGAGGASSLVACPPTDGEAPLTCFGGAGDQPDGCGVGTSGGDIGCYVPGSHGTQPLVCLPADDPALPTLLGTSCESYSAIMGPPSCRTTTFSPSTPAAPACCYVAKVQGMCQARPLLRGGYPVTANLSRTGSWLA